jgi:hypothetical protein
LQFLLQVAAIPGKLRAALLDGNGSGNGQQSNPMGVLKSRNLKPSSSLAKEQEQGMDGKRSNALSGSGDGEDLSMNSRAQTSKSELGARGVGFEPVTTLSYPRQSPT